MPRAFQRKVFRLRLVPHAHARERTLIIGVLNVTPDSFSDGGAHFSTAIAVERALEMEGAGADIIDIGGEQTVPAQAVFPSTKSSTA